MSINSILILSSLMFCAGIFGVLSRRNALGILISFELILNSANLNFAAFGRHYGNIQGQIFSLFGIGVTVCEIALGFSIVLYLFRIRKTTNADEVDILKG